MKLSLHGCRVSRAHFIKDGASLYGLESWPVIGSMSLTSVPLWTVHTASDTHTAGESRERPDRQTTVTDSKTRALCYPRLPLKFQNYKVGKEGLFSVIIYSFSKHLLSTPYIMDTVLEGVLKSG